MRDLQVSRTRTQSHSLSVTSRARKWECRTTATCAHRLLSGWSPSPHAMAVRTSGRGPSCRRRRGGSRRWGPTCEIPPRCEIATRIRTEESRRCLPPRCGHAPATALRQAGSTRGRCCRCHPFPGAACRRQHTALRRRVEASSAAAAAAAASHSAAHACARCRSYCRYRSGRPRRTAASCATTNSSRIPSAARCSSRTCP